MSASPVGHTRSVVRRILLAFALFIGACGDDDAEQEATESAPVSESTTTVSSSFEEWHAQTADVCAEFEPRVDQLESELGTPETPADVVAFIDAYLPLNQQYIDALVAIELPEERQAEVRRTYELYEAQERVALALREAARTGDDAGVQTQAGTLGTQTEELQGLLRDLDLPMCV